MTKIPNLRWYIATMLFLAAILNYIDRQTLSLLAPTIQKDLNLSEGDYGNIVNLFLVAYTISLLVSGRMVDWLGTRFSMAFFITFWSCANMLTGLARSFAALGSFRFLLGLGEAGNWPSSTKAVSEWFPAKERGIAIGFYTLGATIGATIAPLIITFIVARFHWQAAFFITGALGLFWVLPWLWLYRRPQEHPRITEQELALVPVPATLGQDAQATQSGTGVPPAGAGTSTLGQDAQATQSELARWREVLERKEVWLLMLGRMLTDPVWFFYQFWYAKYLFSVRHVAQEGLGITWVVFLAADIGSIGGGLLSAWLIKRGAKPPASRLWAMALCACVMPLSPLVASVGTVNLSLALAMVMVLAHLAWLANISALLVDIIPQRLVATAFGVVAAGSAIGGIVMNTLVATMVSGPSTKPGGFLDQAINTVLGGVLELVQGKGYGPWFVIAAFLHPIALAIVWSLRKRTANA